MNDAQARRYPGKAVAVITTAGRRAAFERARRRILGNAAVLSLMIGATVYAPYAQRSWLFWGISSVCAEIMSMQGLDWRRLWREATWTVMGWTD